MTVVAEVRTRDGMMEGGPGAKPKVASRSWRSRKDWALEAPEDQPCGQWALA